VTVLAVPIYATLDWMEKLARVLGEDHMVTDVGSTKGQIAEAAGRLFNTPERAAFLPGHPMAGKERGGAELAERTVSRSGLAVYGRFHVGTVAEWGCTGKGLAGVGDDDGSKTLDLDPARHDELVAWVSHLPQFVATALSAVLEEEWATRRS